MASSLRRPGGRAIGYDVIGATAGPAVFYFHGWLASRLEAGLIAAPPVRLIAMDRPGYGASDAQRGRRLLDWPADVAALADHLGIDSFQVVGVSGGAPYALACGALLRRVERVTLVCPLPPFVGPGISPPPGGSLARLHRVGRHPAFGRVLLAGIRVGMRLRLLRPEQAFDGALSPADAACLTPALRALVVATWHEGLRRGVSGAVSDARIYASPWGFDLADIVTPVTIWHGTADRVVPPEALAGYAALAAERRLVEGEGHYSLALRHATDIMASATEGIALR